MYGEETPVSLFDGLQRVRSPVLYTEDWYQTFRRQRTVPYENSSRTKLDTNKDFTPGPLGVVSTCAQKNDNF